MYNSPAFSEDRPEILSAFIRQHSFGTLVTTEGDGELCASHLPFLLAPGGEHGVLLSHMAQQNDQWRALRPHTEVLVIFQGPHAYLSPRWYETKLAVPTWNYTAVHAYGRPRLVEARADVRQMLRELTAAYEGTAPTSWRDTDVPDDFIEKMSASIVAFAIDVTRLEGKFKLSQNRSKADQQGVIAGLEAVGGDDAAAITKLMKRGLQRED